MSLDGTDLAEHYLWYEIAMLLKTADLLLDNRIKVGYKGTDISVIKNALLESYLVHVRNIRDFLWRAPRKDDISAKIFCSSNYSRSGTLKTDKLAELSITQITERINKQISHLTKARKRKTEQQRTWEIFQITCDLVRFLQDFISKADKMSNDYKKAIEDELNRFKLQSKKLSSSNSTTFIIEYFSIST